MQAKVYVNTILPAEVDCAVEVLQRRQVDGLPESPIRPDPVRAGQPGEVEAPLGHPMEIGFLIVLARPPTNSIRLNPRQRGMAG